MGEIDREARIFVSGHRGLVGSAIVRRLSAGGYRDILTATRQQLDLRDQAAVNYWFRANRPEFVVAYYGCQKLGVTPVALNVTYVRDELS